MEHWICLIRNYKKLFGCVVASLTLFLLLLWGMTTSSNVTLYSIQYGENLVQPANNSVEIVFSVLDAEQLPQTAAEKCQKHLPKALIVGFAKCGTGTLIKFLDIHPKISAVLDPEEVYYFNTDKYDRGENWYRKIMPCSFADQIAIEKTPSYALSSKVPARVYQMRKNMKIIFLVRDPVERIISHYTMHIQTRREKGNNQIKTYSEFRGKPLSQFVLDSFGKVDRNKHYVLSSLYHEHITKWLEYFQLDDMYVVHEETFVQQPAEELQKIEKYLNIHPFFNDDMFVFNATKQFYCLNNDGEMQCMRPGKGRKHIEIEENLRKKLYLFFETENDKLYKLLRRNFSWTYHQT